MKAASYENPLIPHARMRALYRGLVELRVTGESLPRTERIPRGLEACWAGTAMCLDEGDLTSDFGATRVPDFLRGIALRMGTGSARKAELRQLLQAPPARFAGTATERLLCAAGAAMALKAAGERRIALAFVRPGELAAADWKQVLRVAAQGDLPLVVVAAGVAEGTIPKAKIPLIPVDGADAVGIYRVAQESLLRARAEGGVVVMECVKTGLDPVEVLGRQLVAKGIATQAWMAAAESSVRRVLSSL